jgi:hypothetical protein
VEPPRDERRQLPAAEPAAVDRVEQLDDGRRVELLDTLGEGSRRPVTGRELLEGFRDAGRPGEVLGVLDEGEQDRALPSVVALDEPHGRGVGPGGRQLGIVGE